MIPSHISPRRLRALAGATCVVAGAVLLVALGARSTGTAPVGGSRAATPSSAPGRRGLAARVDRLGLPPQSDAGFHIHVLVHLFVDGRPVPVPAGIGIDPRTRFIAPLHTHDAGGVVHVESARRYPFTLGQVFAVWGVRFTRSALGPYGRPHVWVDGRPVADGPRHVLRAHDVVVIGVGPRGSYPTTLPARFPPGL